ncbi:MAG: hypothetical protein ABGX83_09430 [Nitrospira sp.]|nr:hypothetical protein [Candidatus Manganitrophaceae bacterium]HIL34099.1 hypothetical protein [Candidatus Manganitrophaceae bacterium]
MSTSTAFIEEMGSLFSAPRQYKRIALKKKVLIWPLDELDQDMPVDCASSGWTETVGEGGLCLFTKMKIQVNQVLMVSLKAGAGHVPTLVEVKWISRKFDSWSKVGVKFLI